MERARTESTAVAYSLPNRRQFALKSLLIGGFLGGGTATAASGPLAQQALQGVVLAAVIAGGLFWLVCALAASVTDERGTPQLTSRAESTPETTAATATSK